MLAWLKIWNRIPRGRRPLGGTRLRWEDQMGKDLKRLGARGCGLLRIDKSGGESFIGEAKNHLGIVSSKE